MKNPSKKQNITLIILTAILMMLLVPTVNAEPWHNEEKSTEYGLISNIPDELEPWTPPIIDLPETPIFRIITEFDYFLWTEHGGWWYDAEKTLDNTDDDDMCWAASCSNAQEWTGWGIVNDPVNGDLEDSDDMFQNYNYYWQDSGGFMSRGWDWWFDGTEHSKLETAPSGNYFASETYSDYYDETWDKSITLPTIDTMLHRGDSVTIGMRPVGNAGGHAITCWGYRYDSTKNPDTETDEYYIGIWVTDSDDNKGSNTADPPPNTLRYYDLIYDDTNNRWVLDNYGGGWYIDAVMALAPRTGETRPIADAGSNILIDEGTSYTFSGSGSTDDDSLEYRWDFNEDNLWDTTWSGSPTASHSWPDNQADPVTITLEVFDGILKDVDQIQVTIVNVAPDIPPLINGVVNEGNSFTKTGSFTDPGTDLWTATVDYGDGSGIQPLPLSAKSFTLSHTYKENGLYSITVTVKDDDGASDTETLDVTVNNVAPTISNLNINDVNENGIAVFSGTITDPGVEDTFTLTINWGEGTPETYSYPAGTTSFQESHTYLDDNPTSTTSDSYIVNINIDDDDGGSDTDTASLTVYNLAPAVNAGPDQTADEGEIISFSGGYTDPGTQDTHTITWDFGDGSPTYHTDLTPTHVYANEGTYTATLTIVDDDLGTTSDTLTVDVYNVAPTITSLQSNQPNPQFILPGVHTISFTGTYTDPGWLDMHTASWDYGDGTIVTGVISDTEAIYPDASGKVTGSHTYSDPGTYIVTLKVTDDAGDYTTETVEINIITLEKAIQDTSDYIQSLDESAFSKKADNQKKTLENMFEALQNKLVLYEYNAVIHQLEAIRSFMDGEDKDWITDPEAQYHLLMKIDDITSYIATLF